MAQFESKVSSKRVKWLAVATATSIAALLLSWAGPPYETKVTSPGAQTVGSPSIPKPIGATIALGAYMPEALGNPTKIDDFTTMVGKRPLIVHGYRDWAHGGFDSTKMDPVVSRGAMPMISWEPADWDLLGSPDQPQYALSKIAAGDYDAYIHQFAKDAKAWGKPFYLRFAPEMNGDWRPWGTQSGNPNGNTPDQFVAAWRHVHDIFKQQGVTNVRWVWNPETAQSHRPSYSSLYPGDDYVDWVGIDTFNWGTTQSWAYWQTFPQMFDASYKEMEALTDKPMLLGETASAEQGGDKAAWIKQTFLRDIPSKYPQVKAVVWFHSDNSEYTGGVDFRVNSSSSSLAAYKEVAASPMYQGKLP